MTSPTVAIVVLGARVFPDGRLGGALLRRVEAAAAAFHDQLAALVICSGGKCWDGQVEAAAMRDALTHLGVPASRILLETSSLTTAENARQTASLLRREGIGRIVLVTNHWHMRRAAANFRLCGVQVTPLPAPSTPVPLRQGALRHVFERTCELVDRAWLSRSPLL